MTVFKAPVIKKSAVLRFGFAVASDTGYLFMNVCKAIQDLPEEPPEATAVLVKALVYCVPQSTFFTVLHLDREAHR